jgi:hypothetical protein
MQVLYDAALHHEQNQFLNMFIQSSIFAIGVGLVFTHFVRMPRGMLVIALIVLGVFTVSVTAELAQRSQERKFWKAYQDHAYDVVEGRIEELRTMPYNGHTTESLRIGGKTFEYSDFIMTPGFRRSVSHGSPLRKGMYVRVCYVGKDIARIEADIGD